MSKQETVEVVINIPKPVMDFFEAYWQFVGYGDQTAKEYLTELLSKDAQSVIADAVMNPASDLEALIEKYGLKPYMESMDLAQWKPRIEKKGDEK